jgi:hypothetical protein
MRIILKYLLWFVGLVAMQTFVFDNLVLPGGFIIAFYTLFIFILPFNTPNNVLMIIGFALGLSIDALADTYGLNASAALTLAAIRPRLFRWFEPAIGYNEIQTPSLSQMGWNWCIKVYSLGIIAFYTWYYMLGFLRISGIWFIGSKILFSSVSTVLVILLAQVLFRRKAKKNEL